MSSGNYSRPLDMGSAEIHGTGMSNVSRDDEVFSANSPAQGRNKTTITNFQDSAGKESNTNLGRRTMD